MLKTGKYKGRKWDKGGVRVWGDVAMRDESGFIFK